MLGAPAPAVVAPAVASVASAVALTARLVVEADNQEFDLSGKDNVVIGREDAVSNIYPDVDLTPHGGEEGGVSRLHARIFFDNGQYMLEDENSTNFTFLNRQKLAGKTPMPLHDNDEVRLGRVLLRFKES
jgi:pSer/pThr/pTyr-binding forkhead associated (FHA) protein